jgi:hypothetical protein
VFVYQFAPDVIPNPYPVPLAPGLVVAFAANVFLMIVLSYLRGPLSMQRIEKFHGFLSREL